MVDGVWSSDGEGGREKRTSTISWLIPGLGLFEQLYSGYVADSSTVTVVDDSRWQARILMIQPNNNR